MRYAYFRGKSKLTARPIRERWHLAFATLDIALDATYEVQDTPGGWSASPLHLILGVADEADATRVMEIVDAAGVDWACVALGEPVLAAGAKMTGHEALDLATRALRSRGADIAVVADAAVSLLGQDDVAQLDRDRIQDVLDTVRIRLPPVVTGAASVYEEHESDDLVGLAAIDLLAQGRYWTDRLRSGGRAVANLAECEHCGHLFVPGERVDETYCPRAAPGEPPHGRTCREVGPQRRYHDELDELGRMYRREYKRLDNRVRRGGLSREQVDAWRVTARGLLDTAHAEGWDDEQYRQALAAADPGGER